MSKFLKNLIIILIIGAIGYYGYTKFASRGAGGAAPHGMGGPGMAAPVSVAIVLQKDVQQWNEFSGRLVAVDRVEIRPRISGVIETVNFTNGALVKKDDLLFTIDSKSYAAEVSRSDGLLASANAQASLASTEYARAERLVKEKAIPQSDFDTRRNAYNVAQANLKSAQASLDNAKLNLQYTQVKSPISGKVGRAEITVGNLVEAGANAPVLTTVVSSNPIYADFEVDEETYLEYSAKTATQGKIPVIMSLSGQNAKGHEGYVESFDNRLNTTSGTIRARAVFENADGMLVPGLFARIKLGDTNKTPAVLISDRAVGTDQSKKFVFVVGPDNKVAYREIKLGVMAEGLRVVRDGLKEGEKIVVNGLQRIHPGSEIKPEMVSMETGAASSVAANPADGAKVPDLKDMPGAPDASPEKELKADSAKIPEIEPAAKSPEATSVVSPEAAPEAKVSDTPVSKPVDAPEMPVVPAPDGDAKNPGVGE